MAAVAEAASSVDTDCEMERQLSCSVCLELFRDPVLLPCLHSLCRQCVETLTSQGEVISHTFKCPECNNVANLGPGGHKSLKRNFPLSSMVAIYKQSTIRRSRSAVVKQKPTLPVEDNIYQRVQHQAVPNGHNIPEVVEAEPRHTQITILPDVPEPAALPSTQTPDQTEQPGAVQAPVDEGMVASGVTDTSQNAPTATQGPIVEIPTNCSTCEVSKPRKATMYCETCTMSFCQYCLDGYHPEGMGHNLIPVVDHQPQPQQTTGENSNQPTQCPICDPSSPSVSTVRCLECEMSFCDQCLQECHPSTKTIPGHTLVEIRNNGQNSPGAAQAGGGGGTGTTTVGAGTRSGSGTGTGTERRQSEGQSSRLSGNAFSDRMSIEGLAQLAAKFPCSKCNPSPPKNASFKCLDCSCYLCEGCVHGHQTSLPNHTLLDIRVDTRTKDTPVPAPRTRAPHPPSQPVNVQLKLVELMGIRAEAMSELLSVLEQRRASLERQGI